MKKLNAFLVSVLVTAALNAAVIEQVIVRQQWPWSTDIKVEYKITGVTDPVDIDVTAYDGAVELPLPTSAVKGDLEAIAKDGIGQFVIDPVAAFGKEKICLANFRVKLSLSGTALYKIYSLPTSSACTVENVTAADLRSGKYGSYEEDYSKVIPGSSVGDVMIWTGVTNDVKYMTTHLVMRRIFAKGKSFVMGRTDELSQETKHVVTFTNDFFVSVFPVTACQLDYIYLGSGISGEDGMKPQYPYGIIWGEIRGRYAEGNMLGYWPRYGVWTGDPLHFEEDVTKSGYDCVREGSVAYRLRERTGERFDLPTEAKWEYICRAGTTTDNYAGENDDAILSRIAWYGANADGAAHRVGLKAPNPWGVYDMHGNVWEFCLDAYDIVGNMAADAVVDPVGFDPTDTNCYQPRVVRGGAYDSSADSLRSGSRDTYQYAHADVPNDKSKIGFRLVFDVP